MGTPKLHAQRYEEVILRRGRRVRWQEAVLCSCSATGHPNYECKACMGMGSTLADPIEDIVLVSSVTHNQEFQEMAGVFEVGDAVMTVGAYVPEANPNTGIVNKLSRGRKNPIFGVGDNDMITLLDIEYKTSEVLIKGYPMGQRPADTLINEEVVEVQRIQRSDPETGVITTYTAGTDFRNEKNTIVWLGVNQPAEGDNYTVVYSHRPVFIVFSQLPAPRHQDGQDLPKKVALRYRAGGLDRR
jgi:hypothetical protein